MEKLKAIGSVPGKKSFINPPTNNEIPKITEPTILMTIEEMIGIFILLLPYAMLATKASIQIEETNNNDSIIDIPRQISSY